MPEVGDMLDGYRLDAVIGRGGMGTVYRATDLALEKTVAVKVIAPHLANDETFVARFREEAKALARLDARGIVGIHAMRETDDAIFLVMEHVEGPSLETVLQRRGALDPDEVVSLIRQILRAVQHAHDADVLHRDLKPSNILIASDSHATITDFGLAKIVTSDAKLTATYEQIGTVAYMSPEQVRGLHNVDAASDLFSVGLIAYEMLAGCLPYDASASDFAIQRAIVEESFPPPSKHNPDVPPWLDAFVMRLLAKDPEERPSSAEAALDELSRPETADVDTAAFSWEPPELESASRTHWILLAVTAVVLLGGAYLGVRTALRVPIAPSSASDSLDTPTLSVMTSPVGAIVWIDGDSIGRTPLRAASVPVGTLQIRLTKPGRLPVDTTLDARSTTTLRASLPASTSPSTPDSTTPGSPPVATSDTAAESRSSSTSEPTGSSSTETASGTGVLVLRSQPSNASVALDGRSIGFTPIMRDDIRPDSHRVTLRLDDHRTFRRTIVVSAGDTTEVAPTLTPELAVITLRAIPSGDVIVNGTPRARDASSAIIDSLAPGTHDLGLHSDFGRWEETVHLDPGDRYERTIDFSQTVEVAVTAQTADGTYIPNATVQIADSIAGYTPQRLTLHVGQHTFRVSKDGYAPSTRTIMLESNRDEPIVFELTAANEEDT